MANMTVFLTHRLPSPQVAAELLRTADLDEPVTMTTRPDPTMCAELVRAATPIVATVARNVDDADLLCQLAEHRTVTVRNEVAANPAAPLETRLAIIDNTSTRNRHSLVERVVAYANDDDLGHIAAHLAATGSGPLNRLFVQRYPALDEHRAPLAASIGVDDDSWRARRAVNLLAAACNSQLDNNDDDTVNGRVQELPAHLRECYLTELARRDPLPVAPLRSALRYRINIGNILPAGEYDFTPDAAELLEPRAVQLFLSDPNRYRALQHILPIERYAEYVDELKPA